MKIRETFKGGAGAPTGFARTVPMRDEPAGRLGPPSSSEEEQIRFWEPEGRD